MRSERERESNNQMVCIEFIQQSSGQACTHRKCLQVAKMDQDKTTFIGQLFTEVGNCLQLRGACILRPTRHRWTVSGTKYSYGPLNV